MGVVVDYFAASEAEFAALGLDGSPYQRDLLVVHRKGWLDGLPSLADVPDERLAEYADEELLDEFETRWVTAIRDLARHAQATGRELYCYSIW
ncbi:hypothetical protein CS0771_71680 [Catellatospora sp. IY07-71]|uniref:hypothetical protein n=1 Tax=Catellatospora sp. IY07-71 TaxID=2728827 RepID=UPI001BB32975|nr:hypothetical protein [Catellatospora sp. IY07-71]BCJ77624.1 hypothetical protein CS0771_71680 [Catellatospora sp. IY07-71]